MLNRFIIQLTFVCVAACGSVVVVRCCHYISVGFGLSAAHWSSGGRQSKQISICAGHSKILFIVSGLITSLWLLLMGSPFLYDGGVADFIPPLLRCFRGELLKATRVLVTKAFFWVTTQSISFSNDTSFAK